MSNIHDNQVGDTIAFDRYARQLHADALAHLSPQTLAKLRSARHAANQPRRAPAWRWLLAGTVPALLALGIGAQFMPQVPGGPSPATRGDTASAASIDDYASSLEENPELFVWLASADAQRLALE